jgi:hypothetical protein
MYTYTRLLVVAALLGACVADSDVPPIEAEVHASALQHPDSLEEVVSETQLREPPIAGPEYEAMRFVQEFAAHLDERGVTPEELEAAAMAGDEERVRELLGFTDAEYEAWYARLVAIVMMAESVPEDAAYPDGWSCNHPLLWPCLSQIGPTFLARYGGAPIPVILVVGSIQAAGCVYAHCSYDRTDPGPPVRRP